jgi:hypothetical protein
MEGFIAECHPKRLQEMRGAAILHPAFQAAVWHMRIRRFWCEFMETSRNASEVRPEEDTSSDMTVTTAKKEVGTMITCSVRGLLIPLALSGSLLLSAACSVTETVNDILSSTTPGDWYHDNGLLKEEYKALAFAAANTHNLLQDMAKGRGEYLESMGKLLGVSPSHEQEFFERAQRRMADGWLSPRPKPEELIVALRK